MNDTPAVVGDFVDLLRGQTYKSAFLGSEGPVLLGLASIHRDGGFRDDSLRTYGGETPARLLLHPGDIYVSLKDVTQAGDLLGSVARVPPSVEIGRLTQDTVKLVFKESIAPKTARYLYWVLRSPQYRSYCRSRAIGTTNLSLSRIDFLSFPVPQLTDDRAAVAETLDAIDDKIELNRQTSRTLEETARAIFKSWFVDFDPTRGTATLPSDVQRIFPDRLVNSPMGPIPAGWSISRLHEIVEVIDCLHSRKPECQPAGLPLLQLANIRSDGLLDMSDPCLIDESDYREWIRRMEASEGDCVVTNVGRSGAVAQIPAGTRAALGRNMTGLRCRASFPYPTFLLELMLSDRMKAEIERNLDAGTIMASLNVRSIPQLRLPLPPSEFLSAFEDIVRPIRAKMEQGLQENRCLAELRATLLPKLISGEVRVRPQPAGAR